MTVYLTEVNRAIDIEDEREVEVITQATDLLLLTEFGGKRGGGKNHFSHQRVHPFTGSGDIVCPS